MISVILIDIQLEINFVFFIELNLIEKINILLHIRDA